jgi:hypothetical protein
LYQSSERAAFAKKLILKGISDRTQMPHFQGSEML